MIKKIMTIATATALLGAFAATAAADDAPARPTFTKDVLPILQQNCQDCHRPEGKNLGGMVAPMALISYDEVRPWAKSIAKVVANRVMPPWHVSQAQHGIFDNERTLTQTEIDTIVRWTSTGAAMGRPEDAPGPVDFGSVGGWSIGEPDLVMDLPEPYFVTDDVEDLYVTLSGTITKEQLPEDRWIKAVEFHPGGKHVHHIICRPWGGIAPGYQPRVYKPGYGQKVRAGSTISWQMHYHKEPGPGTGVWDTSQVAIKFYEPGEVIEHVIEGDSLAVRGFRIPPGEGDYSKSDSFTFAKDAYVTGFNPHMHLRGKAAKITASLPDGTEKLLLDVPKYDFNWQTSYYYTEPVFVPEGTKVDITLWWDNSTENPSNPDATKEVVFGRPTTAEMGFGWMKYIDAEPVHIVVGEENAKPEIPSGGGE